MQIDIDVTHHKIRLQEKYASKLLAVDKKAFSREFDEKHIILIQKNMRRYLAQQHYGLLIQHHRRMKGCELKRRWLLIFDDYVFKMMVLYSSKEGFFRIIANSRDYQYTVNEVTCKLSELTRESYVPNVNSHLIKRIAKIIGDNVLLMRESYLIKINLKLTQAFKQVKQLFKNPTYDQTSDDDVGEKANRKRKMRFELAEQVYKSRPLGQNAYVLSNSIVSAVAMSELLSVEQKIADFARKSEEAIVFIQRKYRSHVLQRNLKARAMIGASFDYQGSKSLLMLKNFLKKGYDTDNTLGRSNIGSSKMDTTDSPPSKSKDNLLAEANKSKSASNFHSSKQVLYQGVLKFPNTTRTCDVVLTYYSADLTSKTDYILVNITFHVTKQQQIVRVSTVDLMPKFDRKDFENRIGELLLEKLTFKREARTVVFTSSGKGAVSGPAENKLAKNGALMAFGSESKQISKAEEKGAKSAMISYEKAAIFIQKVIRARQARRKGEILKLSSKRNFKVLKKAIKKVGSQFYQIEYLLIQSAKVLEIVVKLVDDTKMKAKVRLPIKKPELIELLETGTHVDDQILKTKFSDSLLKLESMMVIKQQQASIKVLFEEPRKAVAKTTGPTAASLIKESIEQDTQSIASNSKLTNKDSKSTENASSLAADNSKISKNKNSLAVSVGTDRGAVAIETIKEDKNFHKPEQKNLQLNTKPSEAGGKILPFAWKQSDDSKKQLESPVTQPISIEKLNDAALVIQKNFRASVEREKIRLKKEAKLEKKGLYCNYQRVASLIHKSHGKHWIVYVSTNQQYPERLVFHASEADSDDGSQKKVVKGTYTIPRNYLINTEGKNFYQYLAERILVKNGTIVFPEIELPEQYTRLEERSEPTISTPGTQRKLLFQEQAEDIVVDRYSQDHDGANTMVYNVVYNSQELHSKSKRVSSGKTSYLPKENPQHDQQNTVRIDIEYNELKKFAPHIDLKTSDDLRQVTSELSRSIQLSQEGEVLVNSSKINPKAVKLTENSFSLKKSSDSTVKNVKEAIKGNNNKHSRRQVLCKATKRCGDTKYLFVVASVEKKMQDFKPINKQNDNIYEDYELYFEISASNLSQPQKSIITWEITLDEAKKILRVNNPDTIAKMIISSITMFEDRFLLTTPHKTFGSYDKAMVINETTLRKIQIKIRSRRYHAGHESFNKAIKELGPHTIFKTILDFNGTKLITIFVDNSKTVLDVIAWETGLFRQTRLQVDKKFVQKTYGKDPQVACKLIIQYLDIQQNDKGELHFALRERGTKEEQATK